METTMMPHDESITNDSEFHEDKDQGDEEEAKHFTRNETKLVNRSKWLVYLALALAAAAVSAATYIFMKQDEENTMIVEFSAYSREILKQAQFNSDDMFEELWDISKTITSYSLDSNVTWPNCTLPHFEIRSRHGLHKRSSTNDEGLEFVGFAPFVTPESQEGWEAYAAEHQGWIAQDYYYRGWDEIPPPIPTHIHRYNASAPVVEFEEEMFQYQIPLWQVAPVPRNTSIINLDLATIPVLGHLLWDVRVKKVEQYGRVSDLGFLLEGSNDTGAENNLNHPRGTIYQPVFEDFREDADVVGFMIGALTWDRMFEHVLFESSEPLLVEIEGNCSSVFTYKVTGKELVFLGYGSGLRNTKYDKYKQSADLITPKGAREGYEPVNHTHRSTDASHDASHCTYIMNTYPTAEFEAHYQTNEPIYFTIVVASIFLFTGMVFLLYDWLVQRRQDKLMSTAKRTNAIVSSLFPKEVKDRMMEEVKVADNKKQSKGQYNRSAMVDLLERQDENDNKKTNGGKPIADLFPSATIMFGDICGFTEWSKTREPCDVFILLETLYNSFDAIAKRRRVFKIETIGDCYVAVCGLPDPRKDHALTMARFAKDCLLKMQSQLSYLEATLGADTATLGMRIGLHSGPVTAGVLRGERCRFQLFGDSVNKTARIETTGKKNRIHLSEETATILIQAGKGHWVEERSDRVEAKGLGLLRTFWLSGDISGDAVSSQPSIHTSTSLMGSEDDSTTRGESFANGSEDNPFVSHHQQTAGLAERDVSAGSNENHTESSTLWNIPPTQIWV